MMIDSKEFEQSLWAAVDKLRNNLDTAAYKHVVLGLIFLRYISDAFSEHYKQLLNAEGEFEGADPEDKDEYLAYNLFWIPPAARWNFLIGNAKQPEIGLLIDKAMDEIEKANYGLRGVLPRNFADPDLDKHRLGELLDLIGNIGFNEEKQTRKDLLGMVYEYFLGMFADAEGKIGGQFYSPKSIVELMVQILKPLKGRIYDGCCGSGGMFLQSVKFVEEHAGNIGNIAIYGQESNPTTVKLAKMNLAIRGIDANIQFGDAFTHDRHKELRADFIMANPPFNISDWKGEQLRDDIRWKYGIPPIGNANYAWLQHFISKLTPNGTAGIVLANGSMNSNTGNEGEIRKNMVEGNVIDCMVALPGQLFYNTMIPACLWIFAMNKKDKDFRNRDNEILFIDARKMGRLINRRNRELTNQDILKISSTYHKWQNLNGDYSDIAGFCKVASLDEVRSNDYVLMPGRYVGSEEELEDDISFEEKIQELTSKLSEQFKKDAELENAIRDNLKKLGYEF
jgi:type I restriction enzyme M protein